MKRRTFLQSAGILAPALLPGGESLVAEPAADSDLTLFLCGDIMTGRGIDQVLPRPGDPRIHEGYMKSALGYVDIAEEANGPIPRRVAPTYIWGDALAELAQVKPALRLINLETSVTSSDDFWPGKGIHYRMHPENLPALQAAGVDCCSLANNHVLDLGYAGLEQTLAVLDAAGIRNAGAGRNAEEAAAPVVFERPAGRRLLVFAAGSPSGGVPREWAATADRAGVNYVHDYSAASVALIAAQVRRYRQPGDLVLLSIHWGSNWGYTIADAWRDFAHALVDEAGVDLVHGHSSHHPRGLEVYRGRLILYGCGDFLNDYEGIGGHEPFRGDLALMYFPTLDAASGALARLAMTPMRIANFRLNRATAAEAGWLAKTLDRHSRELGAGVGLTDAGTLVLAPD
jgi:poly-gamma-glutamate synthesis protein (capsule biosynthesis protein)